ncbi:alpha/beta hydrolase [Trinickia caryophylli]|uniref:Acetyl esterase/lipase n=1 Tax=Trinickia caryophylli TaxID=28094 RepID=A0A1X7GCR6_TRICW|nr:alpha/beta hydrolase [Trinickia caryophylli]PMS10814.1 alpha/beta hydrolase [Trinickia caryophylli]TRX13810.1 alpha/beta hydrolase [Trinickia caryophylli]WQE15401.1 alpha/beta hydrolase [Trinickia caryophylli]SMF67782.1 Acetyl esterase/lipase [Trinickia caryophylli]GLU33864.1 carboxylesterase [Trinickia caryophylli]
MRTTPSRSNSAGSPYTPASLEVSEIQIAGYERPIGLRLYRRTGARTLPVLLYFHGGTFTRGSLDDADAAARYFAEYLPALVISVDYSLAPRHPFPTALEDAYRAARWADAVGRTYGANGKKLLIAGHCAGGHIANGLAFVARDRGDVRIEAQALFSPMLDPSMTCLADERRVESDLSARECAASYRAYLPQAAQRMHPYAAPLESSRLSGLPATFLATAQNDLLHVEAETYAGRLIAAGVPTHVVRYPSTSHAQIGQEAKPLHDAVCFFQCRMTAPPAVTAF